MLMKRTLVNALMAGSAGLYPAIRSPGATRKRRKVTPTVRRKAAKRGKAARLIKGSKAAKAYMAKIRRKRRR